VHVLFGGGKVIEVATFRRTPTLDVDPLEANGSAVADVDLLIRSDNAFGEAHEDAVRRDFTINALFYDVNAETVIDHADGLGDLRRRLVRTIGDPVVRFREDPIRILRAIKFAARLGFAIEDKTLAALRQTRSEIPKAAAPRILEEFNRFCRSGAGRRSFELTFETARTVPSAEFSMRSSMPSTLIGRTGAMFTRARSSPRCCSRRWPLAWDSRSTRPAPESATDATIGLWSTRP
jgi:poly(A) polymerase